MPHQSRRQHELGRTMEEHCFGCREAALGRSSCCADCLLYEDGLIYLSLVV